MANRSWEIEKIRTILVDKYISSEQYLVVEENKDNQGREFTMKREVVVHSNLRHIIYRFDPDDISIFPYFKSVKGLHKVCDYFIFCEDKGRFFIFLVELKRRSGSPLSQLEASECFVKFILERAKTAGLSINKKIHIRKIGLKDTLNGIKRNTTFYKDMEYDDKGYLLIQAHSALRLILLMDLPIG